MKVLNPLQLGEDFDRYIRQIPSARLVATEYRTAFESWFRVEVVQSMLHAGTAKQKHLIYNFSYPNSPSKKSDICLKGEIVFELKCFCHGADANKKRAFPKQIALLESHVDSKAIKQGICFITLQGYSPQQRNTMLQTFLGRHPHWNLLDIRTFMLQSMFQYVIAEYHKTARAR